MHPVRKILFEGQVVDVGFNKMLRETAKPLKDPIPNFFRSGHVRKGGDYDKLSASSPTPLLTKLHNATGDPQSTHPPKKVISSGDKVAQLWWRFSFNLCPSSNLLVLALAEYIFLLLQHFVYCVPKYNTASPSLTLKMWLFLLLPLLPTTYCREAEDPPQTPKVKATPTFLPFLHSGGV